MAAAELAAAAALSGPRSLREGVLPEENSPPPDATRVGRWGVLMSPPDASPAETPTGLMRLGGTTPAARAAGLLALINFDAGNAGTEGPTSVVAPAAGAAVSFALFLLRRNMLKKPPPLLPLLALSSGSLCGAL